MKILMLNILQKKAEAKQITNIDITTVNDGHRSIQKESQPRKNSKSSFIKKRNLNKGKTDICKFPPQVFDQQIACNECDYHHTGAKPSELDIFLQAKEAMTKEGDIKNRLYEFDGDDDYDYDNDIYYTYSSHRRRRNAEQPKNVEYAAPWSVELLDDNHSLLCNGIVVKNGIILSLAICHQNMIPSFAIVNGKLLDLLPSTIQNNLSISKNGIISNNLQIFKYSTSGKYDFVTPKCLPHGDSRLKNFTGRCFIENKFFEDVSISDCSKSLGIGSSKETICLNWLPPYDSNEMCEYSLGTPVACETKSNAFQIIGLISTKILPCNINSHIGLVSIGSHIGWLQKQYHTV